MTKEASLEGFQGIRALTLQKGALTPAWRFLEVSGKELEMSVTIGRNAGVIPKSHGSEVLGPS